MTYEAFVLTEESRQALLQSFPPRNPEVIAHHVTHRFGVPKRVPSTYGGLVTNIQVVGLAAEDGLEALVVEVDGDPIRPDGKRYHITLSLDREKGKKPQMSNDLIERGFIPISPTLVLAATFEYI